MSITAMQIIQDALEMDGVYQSGQALTDRDAERSLIVLNDMISQWTNDSLACFANLQQSIRLENDKFAYSIGPGGDVDGTRPLRVTQVYLLDDQGNNYVVELVSQYDWNLIGNRIVSSQVPYIAWYDPQNPVGILNVYPTPTTPLWTLYWTSFLQLDQFTSLTTPLDFPPGYVPAFKTNLAVRLCPYFGQPVNPDIRDLANKTLGAIKRTNNKPQESGFDYVLNQRNGWFNILTGDFNIRGGWN